MIFASSVRLRLDLLAAKTLLLTGRGPAKTGRIFPRYLGEDA
jgi:hypothetical protein